MFSQCNTGYWALTPELQKKFDEVVARTRRLQAELGVQPMTLEERAAAYEKKREEIARRQQELEEIQQRIAKQRPPPKWKI